MKQKAKKRVFVAMSGGVDSSVAAALLKREGYEVVGAHMRCYNVDGCAEADAEDARRAAETLGIPFYTFDFEEEYKKKVVEYMVDGYRKGITPNPDVMCNREIKFGIFLKKALSLGADYVATGHYVKLATSKKRQGKKGGKYMSHVAYKLFTARDTRKDQSYFLWTLTQKELQHCLFPVGEYTKPQVRRLAKKFGLPNAEKKDSQGICFLGQVTLSDFLKDYIPERKGAIVTTKGKTIGTHHGAAYYTIGQRHGLRVGGGTPLYVVQKDVKKNTLVVAEGDENPALFRKEIELRDVSFINPKHSNILQNVRMSVLVRVRYRQILQKAKLVISNSKLVRKTKNELPVTSYQLHFDHPVKFVAPGQSAVFYTDSGEMLGGGIIL